MNKKITICSFGVFKVYWQADSNSIENAADEVSTGSKSKISKPMDKLEMILSLVQPPKLKYNDIWYDFNDIWK